MYTNNTTEIFQDLLEILVTKSTLQVNYLHTARYYDNDQTVICSWFFKHYQLSVNSLKILKRTVLDV